MKVLANKEISLEFSL